MTLSAADKLACVERVLRIRKQTYPGYVARHRMTQKRADEELALLAAIVEDYRELLAEENSRSTLKFHLETFLVHPQNDLSDPNATKIVYRKDKT